MIKVTELRRGSVKSVDTIDYLLIYYNLLMWVVCVGMCVA